MAQLIIADDTAIEVAVLVDADDWRPLSVCAMGPQRRELLQAFADSVPFDLTLLDAFALREAFAQFLSQSGALTPVDENTGGQDQVGDADSAGSDDGAALATHTATNTADTPDQQPADTDETADTQTPTVIVRCWNCEGTGTITFGPDEPTATCGICHGTGKVEQVTA